MVLKEINFHFQTYAGKMIILFKTKKKIFHNNLHVSLCDCMVLFVQQLASYDTHVIVILVSACDLSLDACAYALYALTFFKKFKHTQKKKESNVRIQAF